MLYILNKPCEESLRQLRVIASKDDEAAVLFTGDAVFLASSENLRRFSGMDIDSFNADKEAVEARILEPDDDVELLDFAGMAALVEDYDHVITL